MAGIETLTSKEDRAADTANTLQRALDEIETLRRVNAILKAKVSTFELCGRLLGASVQSEGYATDGQRDIAQVLRGQIGVLKP